MASSGKRKTTIAKLNRERRLRERRLDKQARKDARKQASEHRQDHSGIDVHESGQQAAEQAARVVQAPRDV